MQAGRCVPATKASPAWLLVHTARPPTHLAAVAAASPLSRSTSACARASASSATASWPRAQAASAVRPGKRGWGWRAGARACHPACACISTCRASA